MSSGQKAIAEDEEDWYRFEEKYDIRLYNWDVYSNEARAAKKLVSEYVNLRGEYLKAAVVFYLRIKSLDTESLKESDEYTEYLRLKQKYENK